MPRLRFLTSLLLLALWLPATLHCGWEATGLAEAFACASEHHEENAARQDSCDIIEGAFACPHSPVAVAPALEHHAGLFCALVLPPLATHLRPPDRGVTPRTTTPDELGRRWNFIARTALCPRAPSLVS